ncbi:MAG: glycosyltransferase [Patescibacteria group bacterium]|nr:glycosyltransferase [Patescibacteria group bacterium]
MKKIEVSIISVNYKAKDLLFKCIDSIYKNTRGVELEIIVVNNDKNEFIKKDLKSGYPKVRYIKSKNNLGFGAGNNLGAEYAKGEFLFFLNPDTIVGQNAIDSLYKYILKNEKIGIVAPLLLHENGEPFRLQGAKELTPLRAIFSLSFFIKLFPNNSISKNYWISSWDKKNDQEVDVVPGTAFLIKKKIFDRVHGFDENFFLYFEEFDLCKRVSELGYKIYITPKAKIVHLWERSTKQNKNINNIFSKSRFYYFKKHYGLFLAIIVHLFTNFNKNHLILGLILLFGSFLRFYRLNDLMIFIGDQGWFYLSARDIVISNVFPLVGITSSHLWLHQGPLWTYILAPALLISGFNPVSGAYLTAFFGILSIFLIYKIGTEFFSNRLALFTALIYSASPLVVFHSRMPYHTSLIPFFVLLLFFSLSKWIKGGIFYFPLALFSLSVIYNLELATIVFWPVILFILAFGFIKKTRYFNRIKKKKILFLSLFALIFPMIPVLIYDFYNGFPQTIVFAGWGFYKVAKILNVVKGNIQGDNSLIQTFNFFMSKYEILTIPFGKYLSGAILLITMAVSISELKRTKPISPFGIIFLLTAFGLISYIISNVPSEAYLLMLFPGLIFIFAYTLEKIKPQILGVILVLSIASYNIYILINTNFLMGNGFTLDKRIGASKEILKLADGRKYRLIFKGPGQEFTSSTANYEYLTWWLGKNPPVDSRQRVIIVIEENTNNIRVHVKEYK